jgi:hypothetical protein
MLSTNLNNLFKDFSKLQYVRIAAIDAVSTVSMFEGCKVLEKINSIGSRNLSSGTGSSAGISMFRSAEQCDKMFKDTPMLKQLDVGPMLNVSSAAEMFKNSGIAWLNGDIGIRDVSSSPDMFKGCSRLEKVFASFPYLNVGTNMFKGCTALTLVSNNSKYFPSTYKKCSASIPTEYDLPLEQYQTKQFPWLNTGISMFEDCTNLKTAPETPMLTNGSSMYKGCSSLDKMPSVMGPVQTARHMFAYTGITKFTGQHNALVDAEGMFMHSKIESADLHQCPNVVNARFMFNNCHNLKRLNMYLPNAEDITSLIGNIIEGIEITGATFGPFTRGQLTNVTPLNYASAKTIFDAVGASNGAGIEISVSNAFKGAIIATYGDGEENKVEHEGGFETWTETIHVIDPEGLPNQERLRIHYSNGGSVKVFWV